MARNNIYKKVVLKTYYSMDDGYLSFDDNPLSNKEFKNVTVQFKQKTRTIAGIDFVEDIILIQNQEPINCELIDYFMDNDTLIIKLCQDWG